MTVLVVAASGALGSKLVNKKYRVKVIVSTPEKLPEHIQLRH